MKADEAQRLLQFWYSRSRRKTSGVFLILSMYSYRVRATSRRHGVWCSTGLQVCAVRGFAGKHSSAPFCSRVVSPQVRCCHSYSPCQLPSTASYGADCPGLGWMHTHSKAAGKTTFINNAATSRGCSVFSCFHCLRHSLLIEDSIRKQTCKEGIRKILWGGIQSIHTPHTLYSDLRQM